MRTNVQINHQRTPKPSALHCAVCLAIAAWLGGIGAADAASSKTLTLLPALSENATTRDVFLNSSSQIQLCASSRNTSPRRAGLSFPRPAPAPIVCWRQPTETGT